MARKRISRQLGFTLVELLVAVSLFAVLVSIAAGGFVNVLKTQRQATGLIAANSNASLAIEQMAREIRTGYDFCAFGSGCSLGELAFRNASGGMVSYCLQAEAIVRATGGSCFSGSSQKITADNVAIRHLSFSLIGNIDGDGYPPRITIALGVSSREAGVSESIINLETTVSARTIDS